MMKIRCAKVLLPLAVSMLFAACSRTDLEQTDTANKICFTAGTEERSSGGTNTYTISDFRVSAFRNNQWGASTLMDNVVVTRTGINSWIYSPPVEWPENESVDFFAVSPSSFNINNNQWWYHTFRFDNINCDTDLLVAVKTDVFQTEGAIKLNFRHSLARVQVRLQNTNTSTSVSVSEVELCNFVKYGTFYFPAFTTSPETNRGELFNCWEFFNDQDDITLFSANDGNSADLTPEPLVFGPENLFMIPFALSDTVNNQIWIGTTLRVKYSSNATQREVYIPLKDSTPEGKWMPGVSYRYTLDLSESSSKKNKNMIRCQRSEDKTTSE